MLKRLTIFALSAFATIGVYAIRPSESDVAMKRGQELFELGRWSDARHQFISLKEKLSPSDYSRIETVEFYLTLCSVELEQAEAEIRLKSFIASHPGYLRNNDVR